MQGPAARRARAAAAEEQVGAPSKRGLQVGFRWALAWFGGGLVRVWAGARGPKPSVCFTDR